MTEESVWIINRFGEKLEALLRKPDGNGSFPAVLIAGSNKRGEVARVGFFVVD